MLILACDTSGPSVSVALWQNKQLLAETSLRSQKPHSATLLPLVENLLELASQPIKAIDAFACTVGPGSFTGIRIGVSSVKAMAYAANRPAIGISTLQALAWPLASCTDHIVCPVLDARNHRIFASAWHGGKQLLAEANWLDAEFMAALQQVRIEWPKPISPQIILVSNQPDHFLTAENLSIPAGLRIAAASQNFPRAAVVAELAEKQLLAGAAGIPQELKPQYLSLSQAERRKAANLA